LNICPQGFEDVITRLGSFHRVATPGLYIAIPFIENIYRVDMREITLEIQPTTAITQDNVSVQTGGALYVQIVDATKACFAARQPLQAVLIHAISVMRSSIGTVQLDSLFHDRTSLNQQLVESVSDAASKWGIVVLRYELTDVIPDYEVSKTMDAQATAERKRRETILNAEAQREKLEKESAGQKQSFINVAEGERQKVILAAEAKKAEYILEAEGRAKALEILGNAIQQPNGQAAMNFVLAQEYARSVTSGLGQSSTVFLQHDVTDITKVIAQGMGILKNMNKHSPSQQLSPPPLPPPDLPAVHPPDRPPVHPPVHPDVPQGDNPEIAVTHNHQGQ